MLTNETEESRLEIEGVFIFIFYSGCFINVVESLR